MPHRTQLVKLRASPSIGAAGLSASAAMGSADGLPLAEIMDAYMIVPDAAGILESMHGATDEHQLPVTPPEEGLGEAMPTSSSDQKSTLPSASSPEKDVQKGIRRCAEWYSDLDETDRCGKRHKKNQQSGVPDEQWLAGVSLEPQPGWHKLTFLYAPRSAWQKVEVFAHASTTVGDVKVCLEPLLKFRHNDYCCFGLDTHEKLAYHEEICSHHIHRNPEPLEPRLCIPSRFA